MSTAPEMLARPMTVTTSLADLSTQSEQQPVAIDTAAPPRLPTRAAAPVRARRHAILLSDVEAVVQRRR